MLVKDLKPLLKQLMKSGYDSALYLSEDNSEISARLKLTAPGSSKTSTEYFSFTAYNTLPANKTGKRALILANTEHKIEQIYHIVAALPCESEIKFEVYRYQMEKAPVIIEELRLTVIQTKKDKSYDIYTITVDNQAIYSNSSLSWL